MYFGGQEPYLEKTYIHCYYLDFIYIATGLSSIRYPFFAVVNPVQMLRLCEPALKILLSVDCEQSSSALP